jgi:RNA polymerase sigma-70 factor (ECF subfamily)
LRALLPAEAVEDVTQEVFMAALRGIRDYRGNSLFRTWLAAIIRHKVADFYRQRSRQPEVVPIADDGDDPIAPDNWEERALVQAALQRLPAHYQEVLLLRFAEGKPFDQIAGALGISLEATKSRYRRAVAAVAQGIGLEPVRLESREDLP